jgi:hypothetical protein
MTPTPFERKRRMIDVPKELPLYQCHKQVRAGLIASVSNPSTDGSATLVFAGGLGVRRVSGDYTAKHKPYPGGVYVLYDADTSSEYESFSPPGPFERGYTLVENANADPGAEQPLPEPGELKTGADGAQLIAVRMIHGPAVWLRRDDVENALKASEPVIHEGGKPLAPLDPALVLPAPGLDPEKPG